MTYTDTNCTDTTYADTTWTTEAVQYFKEQISDMIWSWEQQAELPAIHERKKIRKVNAPHIGITHSKRFLGNKFKLGGSKK